MSAPNAIEEYLIIFLLVTGFTFLVQSMS
jgi:hypothetical protein